MIDNPRQTPRRAGPKINHSMERRGAESKRIVGPFYLPHTKGRNLPLKCDERTLSRRSLAPDGN